jgi:membrane-associated phospholipid phosphatase
MSVRRLWITAAVLAVLSVLAIVLVDAPLAAAIGKGTKTISRGLEVLEPLGAMRFGDRWIEPLELGAFLVVAGTALWFWRHRVGRAVLLVGLVDLSTRIVGNALKPPFGRVRPREALAESIDLASTFFREGVSFPSGHVAHFAGLAFPLALLFPRAAPAFLSAAAYVALARISTNDHFLGDCLASAALAAAFTAAYATLLELPSSGVTRARR